MLIYEEKIPRSYRSEFVSELKRYCEMLGANPNWLMQVINFESAGTFSPSIQNPVTNATGLIQFMPSTAEWLGTTIWHLKNMTAVNQLKYVYTYYDKLTKNKTIRNYTDF